MPVATLRPHLHRRTRGHLLRHLVIGLKLGVAHLLEGDVRRASVQVNVHLCPTNLRDPGRPWMHSYHQPTVGAEIFPEQTVALSRPPLYHPVAYGLYLRTNKIVRRDGEIDRVYARQLDCLPASD